VQTVSVGEEIADISVFVSGNSPGQGAITLQVISEVALFEVHSSKSQ